MIAKGQNGVSDELVAASGCSAGGLRPPSNENWQPLVMIVEPTASQRLYLSAITEKDGYRVVLAGSCEEATEIFALLAPDIVVADFNLPDGNGIELGDELRRTAAKPPYLIVMRP